MLYVNYNYLNKAGKVGVNSILTHFSISYSSCIPTPHGQLISPQTSFAKAAMKME